MGSPQSQCELCAHTTAFLAHAAEECHIMLLVKPALAMRGGIQTCHGRHLPVRRSCNCETVKIEVGSLMAGGRSATDARRCYHSGEIVGRGTTVWPSFAHGGLLNWSGEMRFFEQAQLGSRHTPVDGNFFRASRHLNNCLLVC